uniref:G_PROTEIN_RECEP_F1_2 domain-containing protein n=1 Tax=Steinernema glaseri TaxID=37863 RepID=A0A1I7YR02_9BILA
MITSSFVVECDTDDAPSDATPCDYSLGTLRVEHHAGSQLVYHFTLGINQQANTSSLASESSHTTYEMNRTVDCPSTDDVYHNVGILLVHLFVILLNVTGIGCTVIVSYVMLRFKVFHPNLRILLINLGIQLIFRALCTTYRSGKFSIDFFTYTNACDLIELAHKCAMKAYIFASFHETLIFSFAALAFERSWATIKYETYEYHARCFAALAFERSWATIKYETYEYHARWFFRIFLVVFAWIRVEVVLVGALSGVISYNETTIAYCISIRSQGMSWSFLSWIIIPAALICGCSFSFVYKESSKRNRQLLHRSHSLSSRFQLKENIQTSIVVAQCGLVYVVIVLVNIGSFFVLAHCDGRIHSTQLVLLKVNSGSFPRIQTAFRNSLV